MSEKKAEQDKHEKSYKASVYDEMANDLHEREEHEEEELFRSAVVGGLKGGSRLYLVGLGLGIAVGALLSFVVIPAIAPTVLGWAAAAGLGTVAAGATSHAAGVAAGALTLEAVGATATLPGMAAGALYTLMHGAAWLGAMSFGFHVAEKAFQLGEVSHAVATVQAKSLTINREERREIQKERLAGRQATLTAIDQVAKQSEQIAEQNQRLVQQSGELVRTIGELEIHVGALQKQNDMIVSKVLGIPSVTTVNTVPVAQPSAIVKAESVTVQAPHAKAEEASLSANANTTPIAERIRAGHALATSHVQATEQRKAATAAGLTVGA